MLALEKVRAERELADLQAEYSQAHLERDLARSDRLAIPRVFLWVAIALAALLVPAALVFWLADGPVVVRLMVAAAMVGPFVLLVIFGAVVAIGFASRKTSSHAYDELDARLDALSVEIEQRRVILRA